MDFIGPANLIYNRLWDNIPGCLPKTENHKGKAPIIQNDTSTTEYTFKMKFIYK